MLFYRIEKTKKIMKKNRNYSNLDVDDDGDDEVKLSENDLWLKFVCGYLEIKLTLKFE